MIITDLHRGFEAVVVAGGVDPGSWCVKRGAAVSARGYSWMPVHTINLELLASQIVSIADDDAIRCRVEIDHITRTRGTTRQPFALTNRKQFDAVMFTNEISVNVENFAAVEFAFAQMGTQKRLVIVTGNKTNFLAVYLVGDLEA